MDDNLSGVEVLDPVLETVQVVLDLVVTCT